MARAVTNRSVFVRVVCVLSMALVCAMGVVQAMHAHADDSATSHHACSICSTAHAGLNTQTVAAAPALIAAALVRPAEKPTAIFRAPAVHFIRPPPAV